MNRRDFIISSCTACLSVSALSIFATSCTGTKYVSGRLNKDGLLIGKDEFKINQKGSTSYSNFIIIRNDALKYPVCVYRLNENEYSALWMKCSHQGAELQASGDFLQCPAHGSEFDNKGVATTGPASIKLRRFPVSVNGNEIFIDLRMQS